MNERPIPPAAERDANAVELIRVWIAEKGLHCSIKVGMYENGPIPEEKAWGIILADVAKHISNAMQDLYSKSPDEIIDIIEKSFVDELNKPTSKAEGGFVN